MAGQRTSHTPTLPYPTPSMHVLALPSWYPTKERPHQGIYVREQLETLRAHGVEVGVIYPEARSPRRLSWKTLRANRFQTRWRDEGGLPTLRRHSWNLLWRLPWRMDLRIRDARELARQYVERRGRPDLLHVHSAQWAGTAAARISREFGIPYVLTEHFSGFLRRALPGWQRDLAREGFRGARRILAVSTALHETLVQQGFAAADEVEVVPNMVDTSFFTLPPEGRPSAPFRFLALAELKAGKGLDVLLRAFARAFRGRPGVCLEIGGNGRQRASLERQARRLGLSDRMRFLGWLDREAVRRAFWRAQAFVHPSHHETFGVVLIEAMATGLPVVATACGGPEDLVTPETGLLVPPGDEWALARSLHRLFEERSRFRDTSIRNYIEERFSKEYLAAQIVRRYRSVLSGRPATQEV